MTTADLLATLRRRWYVVLVVLGLTAYSLGWVRASEPVYFASTAVSMSPPSDQVVPGTLVPSSRSLIAVAGLVVEELTGVSDSEVVMSDDTSLPGLGIRDGWQVRRPNAGGQWEPNFNRPEITVEVVGPDPTAVRGKLADVVDEVSRVLDRRQAADGVPPRSRITATVTGRRPQVVLLQGSPKRAEVMVVLLGLGLGLSLPVAADRAAETLARRRRRRSVQGDGRAGVVPDVARPRVPVA